jgi:peptidoglycan/LPS O-acetylase OafA/YrhL
LATGHRDYVLWFTLARLDSIAMGALLAVALRDPVGRALAAKAVPWCLAAGVLVVVVLMGLPRRWELAPVIVVKYSALALLFGSLLAYLLLFGHSILGWLFRWRILQFFGKYSYGIYVFHCSFMHMTSLECLGRALHSDLLGLLLQLAIPVAASTAVAFASYHLYEKYFLRLKRYFASQRIPAGRESASPRCAAALQENPR